MIQFKDRDVKYNNVANVDKMPFEFHGTSSYNTAMELECIGTCGCTGMARLVTVQPKSDFKLTGYMTKRPKAGAHKKKITVRVLEKKVEIAKHEIFFTMNIVKP